MCNCESKRAQTATFKSSRQSITEHQRNVRSSLGAVLAKQARVRQQMSYMNTLICPARHDLIVGLGREVVLVLVARGRAVWDLEEELRDRKQSFKSATSCCIITAGIVERSRVYLSTMGYGSFQLACRPISWGVRPWCTAARAKSPEENAWRRS